MKFALSYVYTLAEAKCTNGSKKQRKNPNKLCFKIILKKELESSSFYC